MHTSYNMCPYVVLEMVEDFDLHERLMVKPLFIADDFDRLHGVVLVLEAFHHLTEGPFISSDFPQVLYPQ